MTQVSLSAWSVTGAVAVVVCVFVFNVKLNSLLPSLPCNACKSGDTMFHV